MEQNSPTQIIVTLGCQTHPPYPKKLSLIKQIPLPEFYFFGELLNLFVKIQLLQAMKDVLIYATMIREFCSKKTRRKMKDPPTIHVMGKLSDIMLGKTTPVKYGDRGNLIPTMKINGVDIPNVLVDLGVAINVITSANVLTLGLLDLKPTPTVLELAD